MKKESTLTDWRLIDRGDWYHLQGNTINDPRWPEGELINTSMVLRVDFEKGIAETKNTIYHLV